MIAHRSRDAETTRRTLGLESCRHVHYVPVYISPVGTHVDANPKADGPICGLVTIADGHLLLDLDRTAHRSVSAVEHQQEKITTRVNEPPAKFVSGGVDHVAAQSPQSLRGSGVIQPDQTAVANHVRIDDCHQLPPILRSSCGVRCFRFRHSQPPRGSTDAVSAESPLTIYHRELREARANGGKSGGGGPMLPVWLPFSEDACGLLLACSGPDPAVAFDSFARTRGYRRRRSGSCPMPLPTIRSHRLRCQRSPCRR